MKRITTLLLIGLGIGCALFSGERLLILGGGPAALSSAIFTAQANLHPLVVEGDPREMALPMVPVIENYPGFPDGITGAELHARMRQQAEKAGARISSQTVTAVDLSQKPFVVSLDDGKSIEADSLIIALGSAKNSLNVPGELALRGHGVGYSATLEAPEYQGKSVVVVGGGDTAMTEALTLVKYASHVLIVCPEAKFRASPHLLQRVQANPNIATLINTHITEVHGVDVGQVTGVSLAQDYVYEYEYPCDGLFIVTGRTPNSQMFADQLEILPSGFLATQGTRTAVPGVFVAGEIGDPTYRKVTSAVGFGCMAAMDATKWLATQPAK
jgi:thioredoxin reductase (NADPH)